jgi:hypothetical protein
MKVWSGYRLPVTDYDYDSDYDSDYDFTGAEDANHKTTKNENDP